MNSSRWFLSLILLGFSSSLAMADGVDPAVGLQGDGASTGLFFASDPNFMFTVLGSDFTFIGEQLVEGEFINATGHTAIGVNLFATLLPGTPALTYACDPLSQYFTMCSVTPETGGTLISYFSPNNGEGGVGGIPFATSLSCDGVFACSHAIPAASDFGVYVRDVNGDLVNLGAGQGFHVQGTLLLAPVPEPVTLLLMSTGLGFLGFIRRRQKKALD